MGGWYYSEGVSGDDNSHPGEHRNTPWGAQKGRPRMHGPRQASSKQEVSSPLFNKTQSGRNVV